MAGFDASASALGFLYQVRWAMYELLISSRRASDQSMRMTLEVFDDVALTDAAGYPLSAIQLKHHVSPTSLTDKSVDLWKTIRVWLETPSLAAADGPMLTLVTTSPVQSGSAASTPSSAARNPPIRRNSTDSVARNATQSCVSNVSMRN